MRRHHRTAPPQGTLAYAQKVLDLRLADKKGGKALHSSIHLSNSGGHGFGLCQTMKTWLEICDWPKHAQRFLQDHGFAPGGPWGAKPEPEPMLQQNCAK